MDSPYRAAVDYGGGKDEREGCRSLICDANGIIIAEMCYRCMICASVFESIGDAKAHYHKNHIQDDHENGHTSDDPIMYPDNDLSMDEEDEEPPRTASNRHHNNVTSNSYSAANYSDSDVAVSLVSKPRGGKPRTPKAASPDKLQQSLVATPPVPTDMRIQTSGTNGTCTIKSGYITCPVCTCTKFYTTLQRRYGQFSCVGCYRFFKEFFVRPKRYYCETLGQCPLEQRTKCKACWINTCIEVYTVDESRKELLMAHQPMKKPGTGGGRSPSSRASNGSSGINSAIENIAPSDNSNLNEKGHAQNSNNNAALPMQMDYEKSEEDEEDQPLSLVMANNAVEATEEEEEDDVGEPPIEGDDSDQPKDLTMADSGGDQDVDEGEDSTGATPSPILASLDYSMSGLSDGSSLIKQEPGVKRTTPPRRKTSGRIKNWCCLKCPNCLADDCGKCINCLDRPKFGGPFIRKQRCLYKKCLMKMKTPQ